MNSSLVLFTEHQFDQDELLEELLKTAENIISRKEELFQNYTLWDQNISKTIITLLKIRDALSKHSFNSKCAILSGASATILGSLAGFAGIALTPFTAGVSLALTVGGTAVASAGGAVSFGSNVANHYLSKSLCKKVNVVFEGNIEDTEKLEKLACEYNQLLQDFGDLLIRLGNEYYSLITELLNDCLKYLDTQKESANSWYPTVSKMQEMKLDDQNKMKNATIYQRIIKLVKYIIKDSNMLNIMQNIPNKEKICDFKDISIENFPANTVLKFIPNASSLFQLFVKEAGMVMRVALTAVNFIFFILGMFDLVKTSIDIHRRSETDEIKKLTKMIRNLKNYRKEIKANAKEMFKNEFDVLENSMDDDEEEED